MLTTRLYPINVMTLMVVMLTGLLVLISLPMVSVAKIYQVKDKHGNTVFTDQPSANAQEVRLAPLNTMRPVQVPATPTPSPRAAVTYRLNFTSPINEQAFQRPAQSVALAVSLSPSLRAGHTIQLKVDGKVISQGLSASVNTVDLTPGLHVAIAQVVNSQGRVLASTQIQFYVVLTNTIFKQQQKQQQLKALETQLNQQLDWAGSADWFRQQQQIDTLLRLKADQLNQAD